MASLAPLAVVARRAPPWTLAVAGASAVVFLFLAALVALRLTGASDLGWTRALQSVASDPLDLVANAHTLIGQLVVTLGAAVVLAWIAARRFGPWSAVAPAMILATGAVELVFKLALQHPGPPEDFVRAFHNALGVRFESPSSFPSGHVARVTFLALVAAALYPRRWTWLAAGAVAVTSVLLRVYIGDHWMSDALAGLALGVAFGAAAIAWLRAVPPR